MWRMALMMGDKCEAFVSVTVESQMTVDRCSAAFFKTGQPSHWRTPLANMHSYIATHRAGEIE